MEAAAITTWTFMQEVPIPEDDSLIAWAVLGA